MSAPLVTPPRSELRAERLKKRYGARTVVHDVHVAVAAGEVVGLLGPNGAGKTTSFYMIVGLVPADAGEITIDGQRVERLPIQPHDVALHGVLTEVGYTPARKV